ncbi:glutamine amidotransferase [Geomonas silvestris]|uniref:Glutamine amidotransferase n=1 Tax=Geomonas silvestris TaxID=2740184 RepID=A0A6V8MFZ2_9BACT|nr:type 1 glutamine amidotransferase domain-containing protein [Geomonas silvestris]GFO58814.1 glutamine amidotransferase [Geomonas silvestris]
MKVLILSANDFEDTELLVPLYRLREAGHTVEVASLSRESIKGKHGYEVPVDKVFKDVVPGEYGLLLLPGGKAPAAIRDDQTVQQIARSFFADNKPVAAICHGPQILVSAGLLRGKRATCYQSVTPELKEAGAQYEDSEVVVDGQLVTSRQPEDLPAFDRELMRLIGH